MRYIYQHKDLSADDMEMRLRIWSDQNGLIYEESFDRVDRDVPWEKTDNPHIKQVNDRSGKVYINVITGEECDTAGRSTP